MQFRVRDALARCSQICLASHMEENEVGIWSQRWVVVGRMGMELSWYWKLRREGELGGGEKKHQPDFAP